jgi:hypothetical protein
LGGGFRELLWRKETVMKRLILGLSLALAFGFVVSPVLAADSPQVARVLSATDRVFLASLAASPAARPVGRPATGQGKSLCFAGASCGSYSITCTGNNSTTSCSAADRNCAVGQRGHVTCDGVTTWCNEPCPPDCDQLESNCAWNCYPCNYTFSCDPNTGDSNCHCIFRTCPI